MFRSTSKWNFYRDQSQTFFKIFGPKPKIFFIGTKNQNSQHLQEPKTYLSQNFLHKYKINISYLTHLQ